MALELLYSNPNFYSYRDCSAPIVGGPYGSFCTGASQYRETIAQLESFVYDVATDRYHLIAFHNQVDYPSWSIWHTVIHPETGVQESRNELSSGAIDLAWTSNMWNGGLNKIYAVHSINVSLVEVNPNTGIASTFQLANPVLTTTQIPDIGVWAGQPVLVCPERKLVVAHSMTALDIVVYDYTNHPAASVYKWGHPFPEANPWSGAYEDDERVWGLYSYDFFGAGNSGKQTIMKYNFLKNKVELFTELQPSTPDNFALISWDSKRKKLAAVRIRPDNANGGPNNVFQIYAPRPAMTRITVPVNVNRLSPTVRTDFRSHLLGTKAEGGGSKPVSVSNTSSLGALPRKEVYTQESGSMSFEYQSSTDQMQDTVTVSYNETKVTA